MKCHQYFPTGDEDDEGGVSDSLEFEDVDLQVKFLSEDDASFYTVRTLQITDLRVCVLVSHAVLCQCLLYWTIENPCLVQ